MSNSKSYQLRDLLNRLNFNNNGIKYFRNDYESSDVSIYWNNENNVYNRYTSIANRLCIDHLDGKHIDLYIEYFTNKLKQARQA